MGMSGIWTGMVLLSLVCGLAAGRGPAVAAAAMEGASAGVEPGKVFPHNLRHLFARTFYSLEKDISRLADILGHANVSTTRIYTAESGAVHARQIGRLGLVVT